GLVARHFGARMRERFDDFTELRQNPVALIDRLEKRRAGLLPDRIHGRHGVLLQFLEQPLGGRDVNGQRTRARGGHQAAGTWAAPVAIVENASRSSDTILVIRSRRTPSSRAPSTSSVSM